MTVQLGLVELLDAGLADRLGAAILHRVQGLGFFLVDPPDITDGVGKVRAQRIVAHELRLDIDARQTELIDGEDCDLLFAQLVEQCHGDKRMAYLFQCLVKQRAVFIRQVQQADEGIQLALHIGGALTGKREVVAGAVIGQQHAVAVVDQATRRGDGEHVHPVVFGDGRVVVKFDDLQDVQAHHQGTGDGRHEQRAGH